MAVLLMAQGDAEAKQLLRKAIEARYGIRPLAFDTFSIKLNGHTRRKLGPIQSRVPTEVEVYLRIPTSIRWDVTTRVLGMPVTRTVQAYDGETLRVQRGDDAPEAVDEPMLQESARQRRWLFSSLLLTPLIEDYVELTRTEERRVHVTNTRSGESLVMALDIDFQIDALIMETFNREANKVATMTVRPGKEIVAYGEVPLPSNLEMLWDDNLNAELSVETAEESVKLSEEIFTLNS